MDRYLGLDVNHLTARRAKVLDLRQLDAHEREVRERQMRRMQCCVAHRTHQCRAGRAAADAPSAETRRHGVVGVVTAAAAKVVAGSRGRHAKQVRVLGRHDHELPRVEQRAEAIVVDRIEGIELVATQRLKVIGLMARQLELATDGLHDLGARLRVANLVGLARDALQHGVLRHAERHDVGLALARGAVALERHQELPQHAVHLGLALPNVLVVKVAVGQRREDASHLDLDARPHDLVGAGQRRRAGELRLLQLELQLLALMQLQLLELLQLFEFVQSTAGTVVARVTAAGGGGRGGVVRRAGCRAHEVLAKVRHRRRLDHGLSS